MIHDRETYANPNKSFIQIQQNFSITNFLKIFDGGSNGSPLVLTYCGDPIPHALFSSGNELFIHFKADNSGFKIEYRSTDSKCF